MFITNSNYEDEVAGGGLFVSYADVSEKSALVNLKAHIRNNSASDKKVTVTFELKKKSGELVRRVSTRLAVKRGDASYAVGSMKINMPSLIANGSVSLIRS